MVILSSIMATSASISSYASKSNVTTINNLAPNTYETYTRGRSTRAASLALPNNTIVDLLEESQPKIVQPFNLAPPSASSINIRRHSSHHCQIIDNDSDEQKSLKKKPVLPQVATATVVAPPKVSSGLPQSTTPIITATIVCASPPMVPPPVPKRRFQKYAQQQSISVEYRTSALPPLDIALANKVEVTRRSTKRSSRRQKKRRQPINCNHGNVNATYTSVEQSSDDDVFSIGSPCFDGNCSNDSPECNSAIPLIKSNRSSSDSNKSHIDTGYMTSNDSDRIFFGPNSDSYRSRFSSVDTQSSLESMPDNQTCTSFSSPQSDVTVIQRVANRNDTSLSQHNVKINRSEEMNSGIRRPPAVPLRKQGFAPKLPPPISSSIISGGRNRQVPPVPPIRSQTSLDSAKILQNGHILSAIQSNQKSMAHEMYNKPTMKQKPPLLAQMQNSKLTQRQDSSISNESYSPITSSPSYISKSMEAPLLQYASKMNKSVIRCQDPNDGYKVNNCGRRQEVVTKRQDSNVSSDSCFSQTSSPGYNNQKFFEQPLLAHAVKLHTMKQHRKVVMEEKDTSSASDFNSNNPLIKSASTPASLQTVVRFQDGSGSNMSLHHKIMNRRKSSNPYISRGRYHFQLFSILLNAAAILVIIGGFALYFNTFPWRQLMVNSVTEPPMPPPPPIHEIREIMPIDKNPAPGVCLPIIVKFCESAPYNYTVFPNYIGHFGQLDAEEDLEAYDALVDVKCYELVSLFLCSIFAPKCGSTGMSVAPCKSLCLETRRRCGFFFELFSLGLPEYLNCNILTDSDNPDVCIGLQEVQQARIRAQKPVCSGFLCDQRRCIPEDWRCDGHVDCLDQADESECDACGPGEIYCGEKRCMSQMSVCDGVVNCPYGQDERNCVRLSDRYGDVGKGTLEVYKPDAKVWVPACVNQWDPSTSPAEVCTMLGYSSVNSSKLAMRKSDMLVIPTRDTPAMWRMHQKKHLNLLKEFNSCPVNGNYVVVDLTCSNYECGKIRTKKFTQFNPRKRIVGGSVSAPGDWPFIAAILGGPEEIFYCAGVLISDQWVLTASHCVGNHTLRNINDWTIQLGITRRHSHSYYGEKVKIRRVIPHPQYNSEIINDNDIALFQLATRVAFHEHLLPVCLPPPGMKELKPGTSCTVIGWGKKELGKGRQGTAAYEATINEVQVPVLNRELCNEWLVQLNVTEGMICAGYSEGGKDACQGDSGGPLLCRDPNDRERWFVGGIVSWGVKCAHPKLPGVYANVPKYIPWIVQQMHRYSNNHYDNK